MRYADAPDVTVGDAKLFPRTIRWWGGDFMRKLQAVVQEILKNSVQVIETVHSWSGTALAH